ncbi:hypothetical protein J2Z40_000293 [Cytobacillus eiseniae]|uniref:Uncharacterized protein n=1 Tax=Cytobacillus eiseniae TaxID=762947 RepID=A0ABS4RA20_9BACI|nr:hypothetical protein [Cytobacillus eiseniae]MBP2239740.1 hypothetical protein [Cytobacillus eiseniae]
MKHTENDQYIEVVYEDETFEFLEFIRLDHICTITYITLMNVVTREIFTFEEEKIKTIRKKFHYQIKAYSKQKNHLAASSPTSLYYIVE